MTARRTAARFTLATALVAAFALGGTVSAASAAEETEGLYSAFEIEGTTGFVELSKTDASETPLPVTSTIDLFESIEIVDGVGYAVGVRAGGDVDDVYTVYTWDTATGAVLTAVPMTTTEGEIDGFHALDATVDGTLLTYVEIEDGGEEGSWIASISPVTGAVTLLVNTELVIDGRLFEGLATNPVTGVTYALADYNDGYPAYSPVDLEAGTIGSSETLQGIYDSIGPGWISEGDFDSEGILWFTREGTVSRTDGQTTVAVEATELGTPDIMGKAIAIGEVAAPVPPLPPAPPAPGPQLAATGLETAPFLAIAAGLLAAGALLVVARRRSQA